MSDQAATRPLVWVVDDSPLEARHAREILEGRYEVEVFGDGATMLERLEGAPTPDVLVLDWVMPELSGLDICRFIRARRDRAASLGILMVTAQRQTEQLVAGFAAGADDYLPKPFAPEELRARVGALARTRMLLDRAERAEADFRHLLASLPDPVLVLNDKRVVTYANDEAKRLLGPPDSSVIGQPLAQLVPELDAQLADPAFDSAALLPDLRVWNRIYSPSVAALSRRGPQHHAVALRDVTWQRQNANRRADVYAVVAHDLRSPLTAMTLRLERLLRRQRDAMAPDLVVELGKIQASVGAMIAMTNEFLDFARLESGQFPMERERFDLWQVVADTLEELAPLFEVNDLTIERDGAAGRSFVVGDRRRLGQVVSNLVANAVKFTPPTGTIRVCVRDQDDGFEVRVEDTGCGIDPARIPHLFNRYTRAVDTHHEVSGTGLGLMIVREIVQAHGGQVGATSEPGEGSTFWFRLPRPS